MAKKLSIKALTAKMLREQAEPFFYLAPDIVGSVNNAYPSKNKKYFIVDFNTTDDKNMKLVCPFQTYKDYRGLQSSNDTNQIVQNFLNAFIENGNVLGHEKDQDDMLGEMVDEFGDIYDETDDEPANVTSAPGQGNTKSSDQNYQTASMFTRFSGALGYGGIVW